jgi:DNA-binding NarL/FixJ family response regulator
MLAASSTVPLFPRIDLDLPYAGGEKAVGQIRGIDPSACVLGLFTYEWDESIRAVLQAGASRCLAKDRLNEDLVLLIRNRCP